MFRFKLANVLSVALIVGALLIAEAKGAKVKVAVVAYSPTQDAPVDCAQSIIDRYKSRTAGELESLIRTAARNGAKFVVTPEMGLVGYPDIPELSSEDDDFQSRAQFGPYVESLKGPTVRRFKNLAKSLKIWLVIGFAEVDATSNRYYNTLVAISPKGKVVQSYRKINLFHGEVKYVSKGTERKYFDTPFGRVGMFTCYDIHFAHPARNLVNRDKAEIIAFGTSWVGKGGMSTFRSFARTNQVYFLAANHIYFPDSGVISPNGKVQSHITSPNGVAYGYIKY